MTKRTVIAIFGDDDVLLKGIKTLKAQSVEIKNVYSPYPVHGLDHALGLKRTRLSDAAFCYAMTGASLLIFMVWYMIIQDWPMDIGGKPNFTLWQNLPAFIPITFESAVLCCAHGMVITFYLRSKILPGVTAFIPDTRMTDDKMVMQLEATDAEYSDLEAKLKAAGAEEVKLYVYKKNKFAA